MIFRWSRLIGIGVAFLSILVIAEVFDPSIGYLLAIVLGLLFLLRSGAGEQLANFLRSVSERIS